MSQAVLAFARQECIFLRATNNQAGNDVYNFQR
jgi:hypothetical protein